MVGRILNKALYLQIKSIQVKPTDKNQYMIYPDWLFEHYSFAKSSFAI